MDDFKQYPKFQWSKFLNGGRDEQYVVRAETWEDLKEQIEQVKADVEVKKETEDPAWINEPQTNEVKRCLVHDVAMKKHSKINEGGEEEVWYSHGVKNSKGMFVWCSGQGFKNVGGKRWSETAE